jgi:hypothetical protein
MASDDFRDWVARDGALGRHTRCSLNFGIFRLSSETDYPPDRQAERIKTSSWRKMGSLRSGGELKENPGTRYALLITLQPCAGDTGGMTLWQPGRWAACHFALDNLKLRFAELTPRRSLIDQSFNRLKKLHAESSAPKNTFTVIEIVCQALIKTRQRLSAGVAKIDRNFSRLWYRIFYYSLASWSPS